MPLFSGYYLQDKSENIFDAPLIEYNENNMIWFNKIAFVIRQEEAHMQQGARCTEKNWNQDTHLEFSVLLHQHNNSLSYCRDTGYFPFLPLPSSQQPWFPYHCSLRGSHTLTGTLTGSTQAFPDSAMAPLCR
uniref:Uncharacterized protein n=1 Tax=Aegilops tauschii TaxID=37682 RepID=M8BYQ4_AEGTA